MNKKTPAKAKPVKTKAYKAKPPKTKPPITMPPTAGRYKTPPGVSLTAFVKVNAPIITKILNLAPANSGGCCCCCGNQNAPVAVADPTCNVDEFMVNQELSLDPNSIGVPGGPTFLATRAQISWSVTAPVTSTVTVQVRTRGLDGNPGVPFSDWTDTQFVGQALIDQVKFNFDDFLGTKVEFRVVVLDSSGSRICVGPPDC